MAGCIKAKRLMPGFTSVVWVAYKVRKARKQMGRGLWYCLTLGQLWLAAFLCGWKTTESVGGPTDLSCAAAWQEQLGHCTRLPLFWRWCSISTGCTTDRIPSNTFMDIEKLHNSCMYLLTSNHWVDSVLHFYSTHRVNSTALFSWCYHDDHDDCKK